MAKQIKKLTILLVAIVMLIASFPIVSGTAAVTYEGTGKKADPYLVKTVEQLKGMMNNPTAFYKLANTIDLKSEKNFTPIGNLKNKFKGTFTCDTNSDGTPKYVIKNFTQTVNPKGAQFKKGADKNGYTGYKEDGSSGWEAGLFGATQGATFENIVLLDVNIKSTVEGRYQMEDDYSINPGGDAQATGALIAFADSTKITACGVTGKVTSASNHAGGLIGRITGSGNILTRSYSYATVKVTGTWGSGGLAGSGGGVKLTECFYNGTFTGGETHAGALAGSFRADTGITFQDCWTGGTVTTGSSGLTLGTKNHEDNFAKEVIEVAKNVYSIAKIKGNNGVNKNKVPLAKTNKCYVSTAVKGCVEAYFYPGTKAEIKTAFKGLAAWDTSGSGYPQLKNVHPVKDASKYKVEKATASTNGGNTAGNTTNGGTTNGTTSGAVGTASGTTGTTDSTTDSATDGTTAGTTTGAVTTNGNATYEIKAEIDNSLLGLNKAELITVIVISALILLVIAAGTVAIILMLKLSKAANNALYDDLNGYENTDFEDISASNDVTDNQ